jgi:hypothetical protein
MLAASAPAPFVPPVRSGELWRATEDAVREACLLRAEGRAAEAAEILQHRLPPLIAEWSRTAGRTPDACRQALREMFARVQEQVTTATACKRLVLRSLGANPAPAAPPTGRLEVRRRVPLHDIPGMLDALDEEERAAASRRNPFPAASRPPIPAAIAGRNLSVSTIQ